MLYLRLKQHMPNDRAALGAMQHFAAFGAVVTSRRVPKDDGTASVRYSVLIPAGRRPTSLVKQLGLQAPHSQWDLVDVDGEGFETMVAEDAP